MQAYEQTCIHTHVISSYNFFPIYNDSKHVYFSESNFDNLIYNLIPALTSLYS